MPQTGRLMQIRRVATAKTAQIVEIPTFYAIGAEQRRNPASRALRTAIYGKRGFDSYALVSAEDGQDVTSGDDEVILALVVHLGAAVLGVQHLVADLDVDRDTLAGALRRPGPTARTSPCCGFSLALSGMNRPEAVWVSASACLTMILSSNGVSEIDTVDLLFLKRNRYLPRRDPLARG